MDVKNMNHVNTVNPNIILRIINVCVNLKAFKLKLNLYY